MKTIRETLDQLDEIDRRGFLKGLGAAASSGIAGGALAQSDSEIDQMRQDNLDRMKKMAGMPTTKPEDFIPKAYQNHPNPEKVKAWYNSLQTYGQKIRAHIQPWIGSYSAGNTNPTAEVELRLSPDGTITDVKLDTPSGDNVWDNLVLNAVRKTGKLPPDSHGRILTPMVITFMPKPIRENQIEEANLDALAKIDELTK